MVYVREIFGAPRFSSFQHNTRRQRTWPGASILVCQLQFLRRLFFEQPFHRTLHLKCSESAQLKWGHWVTNYRECSRCNLLTFRLLMNLAPLHCARLDCHAFNVFALGTHEGVEVEIRRFGNDATEHHWHSAPRARATLNFIGCC